MARTFLTDINLAGNQLLNAVVQNIGADPGAPAAGQIWLNTTDDIMRYYDGTAVIDVGGGTGLPAMTAGQVIYGVGAVPTAASPDAAGLVAKTGAQDIAGAKSFTDNLRLNGGSKTFTVAATSAAGAPRIEMTSARMWMYETGSWPWFKLTKDSIGFSGGATEVDWKIVRTAAGVMQLDAGSKIRDTTDPVNANDLGRKSYIDAKATSEAAAAVAALVDSAPGTLDTLNELAAALGDDPNFATTITASLAAKTSKYTQAIVGGSTSEVITHGLGSRAVVVSVHNAATYVEVECDVTKTSTNTITLGFNVAPAAGAYVVTVIG